MAEFSIEERIQLDDTIQRFIPSHVIPIDDTILKQMTFKDLATHYSGLPTRPDNFPSPDADDYYEDYTDELFFEFLGNYSFDEFHLRRQYYY